MAISGKRLRIYLELLKADRPLGIRELQRNLGVSTPSLVRYHLEYLEKYGLVAKNEEGKYYAIRRRDTLLSMFIIVRDSLVPISSFISAFSISFALLILVLFWPPSIVEASLSFVCVLIGLYLIYESVILIEVIKREIRK